MGDVLGLGVISDIAASVDQGMDKRCCQVNSQFVPGVAVGKLLGLGETGARVGVGVGLVGAQAPQVDVGNGGAVAGQDIEGVAVGQ